jgi:hypothetical protein
MVLLKLSVSVIVPGVGDGSGAVCQQEQGYFYSRGEHFYPKILSKNFWLSGFKQKSLSQGQGGQNWVN